MNNDEKITQIEDAVRWILAHLINGATLDDAPEAVKALLKDQR